MNLQEHGKNDLIMLNYFTAVASIILFFFGYMVGIAGFIIVSLLLSALMYFAVLMWKGQEINQTAEKYTQVEREASLLALAYLGYSIYLSLGINSLLVFIKEGGALSTFSFLFLMSLSIPAVSYYWLISHKRSNNRNITPKMG